MKRKIFLISLFFVFFLSFFYSTFAQEVEYPRIPISKEETMTVTETTSLPEYVKYIFYWGIIIGAIAVLVSLILGGFRYLISSNNPAAAKDAQNQISSAILGLIILLASGIIFNTINPKIKTIKLAPLQEFSSYVKLIGGNEERKIVTSQANLPQSFKNFEPTSAEITGGGIETRFYAGIFYKDSFTPWVKSTEEAKEEIEKHLKGQVIKAVEIRHIGPGVYIYDREKDEPEKNQFRKEISLFYHLPNIQAGYGWEFIDSKTKVYNWEPKDAQYIQIKNLGELANEPESEIDYLAVLFSQDEFQGNCRVFFEEKNNIGNIPAGKIVEIQPTIKTGPINITILKNDGYGTISDPASGINSAKIFQLERKGECRVLLFKNTNYGYQSPDDICVINWPILKPDLIEASCPGWKQTTPKSIQIQGDCALVLWGQNSNIFQANVKGNFTGKCRVFTNNIPDLKETGLWCWTNPFSNPFNSTCLRGLAIYPIK